MNFLVDSDYLVGAFRKGDPHHRQSINGLKKARSGRHVLYVLNLVIQETATVLSHRTGMDAARLFLERHGSLDLQIVPVDEVLESRAWNVFVKQTKKGTSFVDCANIACLEQYRLDKILSFDTFYPKKFRLGT